jgi:signal transduction histidine kinase
VFARNAQGEAAQILGTAEDVTVRREAQDQLRAYQEQLQKLTSELSLAEERERRLIASELHDGIGQALAFLKMKFSTLGQTLGDEAARQSVVEIRGVLDQAIRGVRTLTFEISPPLLYTLGLEAALSWLVENTSEQHDLLGEYSDDGESKPLSDDLRVFLFQATRELVANVVKHAAAKTIRIETRKVGEEFQVSVEDDGTGFVIAEETLDTSRTGGYGLFSIRQRLALQGGSIEIHSEPGRGTLVILRAPLSKEKVRIWR